MQRVAIYGIIAALAIAAGIGVAFAAISVNDNNSSSSSSNTTSAASNNSSDERRVVKHAMGETEIIGTPERIVALEWTYAEDLLVLGVQPVGVADIEGMNKWVEMKELSLSADVVDVGTRQQPNLEKISQLNPDLIITDKHRAQGMYNDLSEVAPTIVFDPYTSKQENIDHLKEMEQTLMTIADVINRSDAGAAALQRMNDSFARAAQSLGTVAQVDNEFLVVQAYTGANDASEMRIFTENSIPAQIMNRLGFENAWDVEYELYGFSTVGLEALTDVQHANFFYVVQEDDNVFANEWNNNPVWQNLEFVKEKRAYPLGGDTWLFGGPISAEIFAEKVANSLSGGNGSEGDDTRTISYHAMGTTEISDISQSILAIGPEFIKHLLTLGVQPAGLYGEFYEDLDNIAPTVLYDLFVEQGGQKILYGQTWNL